MHSITQNEIIRWYIPSLGLCKSHRELGGYRPLVFHRWRGRSQGLCVYLTNLPTKSEYDGAKGTEKRQYYRDSLAELNANVKCVTLCSGVEVLTGISIFMKCNV